MGFVDKFHPKKMILIRLLQFFRTILDKINCYVCIMMTLSVTYLTLKTEG